MRPCQNHTEETKNLQTLCLEYLSPKSRERRKKLHLRSVQTIMNLYISLTQKWKRDNTCHSMESEEDYRVSSFPQGFHANAHLNTGTRILKAGRSCIQEGCRHLKQTWSWNWGPETKIRIQIRPISCWLMLKLLKFTQRMYLFYSVLTLPLPA